MIKQNDFLGYRRETAASACAITSSSCRSTICRTRRRGGRPQHQGHDCDPASVRPPAVRRRPRPAFPHADRRGRNPNVAAVVVICIEEGWAKRVVDGIAKTGKPVTASASNCTATTTRSCARPRSRRSTCSGRRNAARRMPDQRLWVSTKCGESDTTSGCGANPTVGNAFDKLEPLGVTMCFGETTGADRRRTHRRGPLRHAEVREKFMFMFDRYQDSDQPPQDRRPVRFAADQGQHRRRADDDRGEGARQHPEDRQEVHGRRRARQGRSPDASRAVVHGFVVGGGRDGHAVRGVGLRGSFLSDRPGQRDRQPDRAGHQDLRESAHRAHDERAHRRRLLGTPAARENSTRPATS